MALWLIHYVWFAYELFVWKGDKEFPTKRGEEYKVLYLIKEKWAVKSSSKSLDAAEEQEEAMVEEYDWGCRNVSVSTQS